MIVNINVGFHFGRVNGHVFSRKYFSYIFKELVSFRNHVMEIIKSYGLHRPTQRIISEETWKMIM